MLAWKLLTCLHVIQKENNGHFWNYAYFRFTHSGNKFGESQLSLNDLKMYWKQCTGVIPFTSCQKFSVPQRNKLIALYWKLMYHTCINTRGLARVKPMSVTVSFCYFNWITRSKQIANYMQMCNMGNIHWVRSNSYTITFDWHDLLDVKFIYFMFL